MLLSDLLKALSGNANVNITLSDADNDGLITFNAGGYAAVESDLGKRTVKKVKIVSAQAVTIMLDAVSTNDDTTDSDPDPTSDPGTDPNP